MDEILVSKVAQTCSTEREGVASLLDDKAFLKVIDFLLECEKIVSKFNFFSRKYLVFKAGVSEHDSRDAVARVAGK